MMVFISVNAQPDKQGTLEHLSFMFSLIYIYGKALTTIGVDVASGMLLVGSKASSYDASRGNFAFVQPTKGCFWKPSQASDFAK